jgi:ATP synthase protein I
VAKPPQTDSAPDRTQFGRQVAAKVARKLNAQRLTTPIVWSGLGMMGLVGWSVTVPTLLGAALGAWLDKHHPQAHSWTLALLVGGLALGCWNAWHWVARQGSEIQQPPGGGHD